MAVDTKHPDYIAQLPAWQMMRDLVAGQRAMHAAGERYLPKLIDEPPEAYEARLKRTNLFNATWRTIEALAGMMFRKDPTVKVSPATEPHLKDVTKSGVPLFEFAHQTALERLTVGKVGVLDDYPPPPKLEPGQTLSVAQAEALNVRPNMAQYLAENIINWRYGWVNNRTALVLAVLEENVEEPDPFDKYKPKCVKQWRVLELVDGAYTVTVVRKNDGGQEYNHVPAFVPRIAGQPLTDIPLVIHGDGLPPLEDLGHVNVSHYQSTADVEHGAHQTALPQPWITGIEPLTNPEDGKPIETKLYIGGGSAWALPNPNARVGMLEYTGKGLEALETRLDKKEKHMAVLGARMLEEQKNGVESADTAGIHRSGEQSILQRQAGELSRGFTQSLVVFDRWSGGSGVDVSFDVNKDFLPTGTTAQEVTALVAGWQAGAFTEAEVFEKLQKGGWIREGKDFEDHATERSQEPPALSAPAAAPGAPGSGEA